MDAEAKRKLVSYDQLTALLEFLKEHEDLAKGLTRGRQRRGKFHTAKVWNLCAKKLNNIEHGAIKSGKGWSKYWCDWKYRVRRRALELKALKRSDIPLPESMLPLTLMEENVLSLIGESAVEDVVICDPLSDEALDEETQNYTDNHDDSPMDQYFEIMEPPTKSRKRRQPPHGDAVPSRLPERKPRVVITSGDTKGVGKRSSKRLKMQRSPINFDTELGGPCSPLESKPKVVVPKNKNSDGEDKASAFLSIERKKLFSSGKIINSLQTIRSEISRLTSIMGDIKDYLVANYRQIRVP